MPATIGHRMIAARDVAAGAMLLIWTAASIVAAQDAPAGGCFAALLKVSDCLTYVEEGSNLTAPAKPCCPELSGLVESNLTCLCELIQRVDTLGVKIDVSRMLGLPSACNISTPPSSLCSGAVGPAPLASEVSPKNEFDSPGVEEKPNHGARRTSAAVSALAMATAMALLAIFPGA